MLSICLLGPLRVERDGQAIPRRAWARPKDRAVLKLLALDRGHLVPQDRLLDALWPSLAPASAANSLHASISRLRKLLGPATIVREAGGYMLTATADIQIDVEQFRHLLAEGREWRRRDALTPAVHTYRAAMALYHGDLLEEDPYEEWALRPREQLHEAYLALLEELADCLCHLGASPEAAELCERGLAQDPTREGLYVQLMRAYGTAGHVAAAVQVYERCRRVLAEELGVEPGPAIRAIHARLLTEEGLDAASPSSEPAMRATESRPQPGAPAGRPWRDHGGQLHLPCVGRERELARLTSALDAAQSGRGSLVLLRGEPGIGKSRLLEEVERLAASRGGRPVSARCYEMERDLPYAPIVDALSSLLLARAEPAEIAPALGQWGPPLAALIPPLRTLVPALPPHRPLRHDAERAALLAGLSHLVISLGRRTPLTLLLDDLQWADASTIQWLHYLARRLGEAPVLIAGAYRTGEVGFDHPLQRLLESLAGDSAAPLLLDVSCLGAEHVEMLLPAISGSAARGRALAARLHGETDGHPLFLIETLRTLIETGTLQLDEHGTWDEPGDVQPLSERRLPLPPTLREAIRWRIRRLNERERRVLLAAAVVARGCRPDVLARMTELAPDTVLDALESLVHRQLVRLSPQGDFDFQHDLIQAVVYADLTPDRRRSLHARAAEALEALADRSPEALREAAGDLAHHWREAEQWASAFRYSVLAGDFARDASAPREALVHYRRAAEMAGRHPALLETPERLELVERLGRAHADLGELDEAVGRFTLLRSLAHEAGDGLLEGRALTALADAYYWRHDLAQAQSLAGEALARSQELGSRDLVAAALVSTANVAMALGQTDEAERYCGAVLALDESRVPADGADEPVLAGARLNALGWLGMLHQWKGDHERAMPAIEASLRLGESLHNPFLTGRSRFAKGMSLGNCGRYEEALAALREALRLAEEAGDRYWLPRLPNTIGWVYAELGDLRQAEDWNRRSIAVAHETRWLEAEANARVNLGADALRRGDKAGAREELEQAATLIERDSWFTWRYRMRLLIGLGELALLERAPERALAFAREALALAGPTGSRKHAGRAWLLSGRATLAAGGPPEDACTYVERARSLARIARHPPLQWASSVELAQLYARLGREVDAAACREEARAAVVAVAGAIHDASLRRSLLDSPAIAAILAPV